MIGQRRGPKPPPPPPPPPPVSPPDGPVTTGLGDMPRAQLTFVLSATEDADNVYIKVEWFYGTQSVRTDGWVNKKWAGPLLNM